MSVLNLIVLALAVEAVVEIILHSEMPLIVWWRTRAIPEKGCLRELVSCGWCLSLWVAAALYGLMALRLTWILYILAGHRLSNFIHFAWGLLRKTRFKETNHAL